MIRFTERERCIIDAALGGVPTTASTLFERQVIRAKLLSDTAETLLPRIYMLLGGKRMSQQKVAELAGCTWETVNRWLQAQRVRPAAAGRSIRRAPRVSRPPAAGAAPLTPEGS